MQRILVSVGLIAVLLLPGLAAAQGTPADPALAWLRGVTEAAKPVIGDPCGDTAEFQRIAYANLRALVDAQWMIAFYMYGVMTPFIPSPAGWPAAPSDPVWHAPAMEGRQCSDPAGWASGGALDFVEHVLPPM